MPKSDAELRACLLAQAEGAVEQMLKNCKAPAHASLADIEQAARAAGQQVAQGVTGALAAESASELPPWPNCPQCGKKMKHKGRQSAAGDGDR